MAKLLVTDELAADRMLVEHIIATDPWPVPTIPGLIYRGWVKVSFRSGCAACAETAAAVTAKANSTYGYNEAAKQTGTAFAREIQQTFRAVSVIEIEDIFD